MQTIFYHLVMSNFDSNESEIFLKKKFDDVLSESSSSKVCGFSSESSYSSTGENNTQIKNICIKFVDDKTHKNKSKLVALGLESFLAIKI